MAAATLFLSSLLMTARTATLALLLLLLLPSLLVRFGEAEKGLLLLPHGFGVVVDFESNIAAAAAEPAAAMEKISKEPS